MQKTLKRSQLSLPSSKDALCIFLLFLVDVPLINTLSRRIDLRLLPLLGLLYAVALIDRTNLGVARTAEMGKDLVSILLPACIPADIFPF